MKNKKNCFIEFVNHKYANNCKKHLNEMKFYQNKIVVEFSKLNELDLNKKM